MIDEGHRLTNQRLEQLESRIAEEYKQAEKEVEKKLKDYLEKTEAGRKQQEELLTAGKITKKEYSDWCYRHTMVGKRWEQMKEVLASDYHNANQIALKMTKDAMPDVYALNGNYATYMIEHDGKIDTGFTLYNHDTAEYLLGDQRQLMPKPSTRKAAEIAANKDMQWNMQKIQSAVLQGVLQGESPYEVAERLQRVGQMNYNSAVRYARTMTTSAQNAGRYEAFRRADDLGVDLTIEWQATLDDRTRTAHRQMHGQRTTVDEPFYTPDRYTIYYPADCTGDSDAPQEEIWNCFIGKTPVATDSEIVRSYRHKYKGELIHIKTARGVEFTCTPNHPILTPSGWVAADALNEGDNLLVTRVGEFDSSGINPNVNHIFPRIKAIHQLYKMLPCQRASGLSVDFHGDRATSNVEIISKKWFLRIDRNTGSSKARNKFSFKNARTFILGKSHFVASLRRIYISSLCLVCSSREALTLFFRSLRHSDIHGLGTVTGSDTSVSEYPIDNLPAMTNIRRELLNGLTGKVFLDNIVAVNRKPSGLFLHVYNLQTENGYYFVGNSITQNKGKHNGKYYAIAKNCRCTLISWVKGFEGETVKSSPKMGDMSFEEWQGENEEDDDD